MRMQMRMWDRAAGILRVNKLNMLESRGSHGRTREAERHGGVCIKQSTVIEEKRFSSFLLELSVQPIYTRERERERERR